MTLHPCFQPVSLTPTLFPYNNDNNNKTSRASDTRIPGYVNCSHDTQRAVQLIQSIHSTHRPLFTSSYNCLLSLQYQAESRSIRKLLSAVCIDWPSLGNHRNNPVPVSSVDTRLSNILNDRAVPLPCFSQIRTKQQYLYVL